ncbi:hypothetical protein OG21DRAFT_1505949, partial [Imleria badia]
IPHIDLILFVDKNYLIVVTEKKPGAPSLRHFVPALGGATILHTSIICTTSSR